MEHSKPWKVDKAPVNHIYVVCKLVLKLVTGVIAANALWYRRDDLSSPTAETGLFSRSSLYNTAIFVVAAVSVIAYAADDAIVLARARPGVLPHSARSKLLQTTERR